VSQERSFSLRMLKKGIQRDRERSSEGGASWGKSTLGALRAGRVR
jgi:hypothetical protein